MLNKANIKAVFFDLDGTLVDTAPDLAHALNRVRGERGLTPLPYPQARRFMTHGSTTLLSHSFEIDPEHEDIATLRQLFLQYYEEGLLQKSYVFHPFRELLQLFHRHNIPWGIVTNKPSRFAHPLVKGLRLPIEQEHIVCGDSTEHLKPHPAPVLLLCQRLGVEPGQSLLIGDSQADMHAGKDAGVHTALALWGYHAQSEDPRQWPADIRFDTPLACYSWLRRVLL